MKNYFKKFSIMFIMLLAIIGVGIIQNGTVASAAIIGQQLTAPEDGWQRSDDYDENINYIGTWIQGNNNSSRYYKTTHETYISGDSYSFLFYGTKFRVIADSYKDYSSIISVKIDELPLEYYKENGSSTGIYQCLLYQKLNLALGIHKVEITNVSGKKMMIDAIDIDKDGYLINPNESIDVDTSSIDLTEGDSEQLTATTTPSSVGVTWVSSDPSIATIEVDPTNGKIIKVTAIKEGTCTITATTTDGSNLSASCTVNVAKKENPIPENPTDSKTGAILIINLNDGETKVFDVSSSEISKFKSWYNTKTEYENKLTYEFDKTVNSNISIEEFVVHEKITSFEIRKY